MCKHTKDILPALRALRDQVMTPDRFNKNGLAFDTMVNGMIIDRLIDHLKTWSPDMPLFVLIIGATMATRAAELGEGFPFAAWFIACALGALFLS